MAEEHLDLHLTKDDLTNAEDLLRFHQAQKHDVYKDKVKIRTDHWAFNSSDFENLLRDYRAMRKRLRLLGVDVEWKRPRKDRVRFDLDDDSDVPKFLKKDNPGESSSKSKKRVKLDEPKKRVRLDDSSRKRRIRL